ncbi:pantoate--beta-alanine ligase [Paenibacillus sp. 1011MAR3C5]|uniref:pantoate--beta-alanine ligase n=1 Tax=Paenibacillus sp. 1011MAR3C5 TaxID=1675787 RepID=UPI000E6D3C6E|nr:pantoate--beta-alanine ligase [Paenibacillus sp. 1011MAR3C5]RJE90077.1 pantoate--beta-alanine ligase [Paenibacillus sp. 1011MAR3C5]
MIIARTIVDLKEHLYALSEGGRRSIGYVPTMGYLHEGHASLMREAKSHNDITVLSIFVNPTQFGPNEDLDRYPRDEERDLKLADECGINIVFLPAVQEMYPRPSKTSVIVSGLTDRLCGASRPGHFDGVGLVVSKLFHLIKPDRAYFGMKDAQQVAVIQQMVDDLNIDTVIVPCPTVREPDGLALSSRNVYLSAEHRAQAVVLSQSLAQAKTWIEEEATTAGSLLSLVKDRIESVPDAVIDYVELLQYPSLDPLNEHELTHKLESPVLLAMAVKFGTTRLIDNSLYHPSGGV